MVMQIRRWRTEGRDESMEASVVRNKILAGTYAIMKIDRGGRAHEIWREKFTGHQGQGVLEHGLKPKSINAKKF
jgi:hypothetical protein